MVKKHKLQIVKVELLVEEANNKPQHKLAFSRSKSNHSRQSFALWDHQHHLPHHTLHIGESRDVLLNDINISICVKALNVISSHHEASVLES